MGCICAHELQKDGVRIALRKTGDHCIDDNDPKNITDIKH